jgi:hypothetical protein
MATQHYNLSEVLRQLGDLAGARSQLEQALEIGQATLGPTTPTRQLSTQPRQRCAAG